MKKAELLALTEKLTQTQSELLIQKRILEDIIRAIRGKHPKKRLGEQEFFLRCSSTSDELIKELKRKVSKLESQQREKIAEVLRVKRFKEGLEKLQAEAKARFIREQEHLEQRESDERTTMGFARKMIRKGNVGNASG